MSEAPSNIYDRHSVVPYMIFKDTDAAIAYYRKVFGAQEHMARIMMPDGRVGHAQVHIGDTMLMMADEFPEMDIVSAETLGGSPIRLSVHVPDVDVVFQRAVDAGATVEREIQDQFYGDRSGTVRDPFGYGWTISTHIEDVPEDELQRRAKELFG